MALQRPFDHDGQHYPEAYTRITTVRVDAVWAYVYAVTYPDRAVRLADGYPIFAEEHRTELSTLVPEFFPACYAFLKTLPGFEQAIDVNPDEYVN